MISVIGAGAMGTALAVQLARAGRPPAILATAFDEAFVRAHRDGASHPAIGVPFPPGATVHTHDDWAQPLSRSKIVVVVVATPGLVPTVREAAVHAPADAVWAVATKGWEEQTLRPASRVVADELGDAKRVVSMVGPSLAREVASGLPTAMVCASADLAAARLVAETFGSPLFRTYVTDDVAGVEVGAALKNVIAIAVGMCDGLRASFAGDGMLNAQAFVFSRGLVEMTRLARALGGRNETVLGLTGAGDLYVTCLGGRNGQFGRLVGQGIPPEDAMRQMNTTVEGYANARPALRLAERHGLDLPVVRSVARVLYEGESPREALEGLLRGPVQEEM